jgi:YrbI family 3-deoxy-D-manno-octulosonate 8-phosphate phosphatase
MPTLAVIPARSGSQGIPDKNIRPFCGVPLVVRAVKAAQAAQMVDRVVVSTDSQTYADICRAAGAEVMMRPPELATNAASSESALLHVLEQLQAAGEELPEWLVFQQCTSPFTRSEDIDSLLRRVHEAKADSGFTAVKSHRFLWRVQPDGLAEGINHDKSVRLRRQDREPEFMENGAVYVMKTDGFLKHKHRFFGKTVLHEVPEYQGFEIDSEDDWQVAEQVFRKMNRSAAAETLPAAPKLIVFDFDGVFTDNRVLVDQDGKEAVFCDRGDGMAIEWLRNAGIRGLILSKERNPVVEARAKKVGLPVAQAVDGKAAYLRGWCTNEAIDLADVVYLGNDLNDLECFDIVGCSVAVSDAAPQVLEAADLVLSRPGGRGAIRELIESIPACRSHIG